MVSLITPSTVCKRFKIQLLASSLVVSDHHKSLRFLNLCFGNLLNTVSISRFFVRLIVRCLYMNLIFLVLCSVFDLILILFALLLLAHCYYLTSIKNHMDFVNFYMLLHFWNHPSNNIRSASTYVSYRKNLKTYRFNQAFPT